MFSNMINNLKASQLDEDTTCEIINAAIDKAHLLGHQLLDKYDVEEEIDMGYEVAIQASLVNMMLQLMEFHQAGEQLTTLTIIGARKRLDELGFDDDDIEEMEEEDIAPHIEDMMELQHTFSDLCNNQLRDILFEVAKRILDEDELLEIL